MKARITLTLFVVFVLTLALVNTSYNIAWSKKTQDKDYCYDQVGEHHLCFDTRKECNDKERQNDQAETPCYNGDKV